VVSSSSAFYFKLHNIILKNRNYMEKVYTDEQLNHIKSLKLKVGDCIRVRKKTQLTQEERCQIQGHWFFQMDLTIGKIARITAIKDLIIFAYVSGYGTFGFPLDSFIPEEISIDNYEIF